MRHCLPHDEHPHAAVRPAPRTGRKNARHRASPRARRRVRRLASAAGLVPGIAICLALTVLSLVAQAVEEKALGHPYIEALVVAILVGMAVRALWTPGTRWQAGIAFSAKQLLEVAVMLLGARSA